MVVERNPARPQGSLAPTNRADVPGTNRVADQPSASAATLVSAGQSASSTSAAQQPPRPAQPAATSGYARVEFGRPSVPRPPSSNHLFNIPKHNRPRPEFHRPVAPGHTSGPRAAFRAEGSTGAAPFQRPRPSDSAANDSDSDVVEIAPPSQVPGWSTFPVTRPPVYSTHSVRAAGPPRRVDIDLTDPAYNGGYDGHVDASKATDEIKALLEGAFEGDDEDDSVQLPNRQTQNDAGTDNLADQLAGMQVTGDHDQVKPIQGVKESDVDAGAVDGLKVKLLPHQIDGVAWMRAKELGKTKVRGGSLPKGGILADDMGLGKTIQSIALLLTNPRPPLHTLTGGKENAGKMSNNVGKGTLVVAPLALIKQWEAEIESKVESSHRMRVLVHHGPQRTKRAEDLRRYDVVITTYQTLVSEYGSSSDELQCACMGVHWYRVILDEAHSIKNRNAKASQACCALKSEFRWCLTGTPMQNNLDELQSLIKFLRIKPYNDLSIWKAQITQPLASGRGQLAIERLQAYLKAFMKRRTKDILKKEGALSTAGKSGKDGKPDPGFKIVQRTVKKLEVQFSPREREFYDRLEARTDKSIEQMMGEANMSYASALTLLLRLRQACNHAHLVTKGKDSDKDARALDAMGAASPSKKKQTSEHDIDDMVASLGGLSMSSKQCDVCQIRLSKKELAENMIRCADCQADVDDHSMVSAASTLDTKGKKQKSHHGSTTHARTRKERTRRIIDDSDEDEEEGEWIVPKNRREDVSLGKAGGSEDENAEGGGEWLNSDDTNTSDEDSIQILGSHRKKVINLDTSDEDTKSDTSEASSSDDGDANFESAPESPESEAKEASQLVVSTKIVKLMEILRKESRDHKFIVFSVFTSMLDLIEPFLQREAITFTRYDGSMRNDMREASLDRLRKDEKTRVMLCSLKCGSLGLNLTAASRVIILEPFWNPFVEEQAIDRVHRLNQTVDVTVYKLTVMQTVEERIFELQEKKRALAEAAIEGKAVAKLSMQDLLNLFKHDRHDPTDRHDRSNLGGSVQFSNLPSASTESDSRTNLTNAVRQGVPHARKARPAEHAVYGRRW